MAQARKRGNTAVADKPETGEFSFADVAIGTAPELPKAVRALSPNPLASAVADALDQEARYLTVPNGERAKEAEGYLRRAGNENEWTVRVRFADEGDKPLQGKQAYTQEGTVHVYFTVSSTREGRAYTARRYTTAEIREHFGLDEGVKITPEQRAEFREVKGFNARK